MKIVKVDIDGTRGLALRDAKGSRVTVARVRLGGRRRYLRYIGVHGREATVYRRQGRWEVSTWDSLRTTKQPRFTLLRAALAVARQHVGLHDCRAWTRRPVVFRVHIQAPPQEITATVEFA